MRNISQWCHPRKLIATSEVRKLTLTLAFRTFSASGILNGLWIMVKHMRPITYPVRLGRTLCRARGLKLKLDTSWFVHKSGFLVWDRYNHVPSFQAVAHWHPESFQLFTGVLRLSISREIWVERHCYNWVYGNLLELIH